MRRDFYVEQVTGTGSEVVFAVGAVSTGGWMRPLLPRASRRFRRRGCTWAMHG